MWNFKLYIKREKEKVKMFLVIFDEKFDDIFDKTTDVTALLLTHY